VKERKLNESILATWVEQLTPYAPEKLAHAFNRVEREIRAFPDIADVIGILQRDEFDAEFAVVLNGLRRHGLEWEDREAWKEDDKRDWKSAAAKASPDGFLVIIGKFHPAEPAPVLSARMEQALGRFGRTGTRIDGLKRLKRDHPAYWDSDTSWETGQHGKQADAIDREMYAAWLRSVE
jgi:hypothetical protein